MSFPILLVDDDPLLAEVLIEAAKINFPEARFQQVYSAGEAKRYIDQLEGYGPKLILLDINLNEMNTGFNLLAYIQVHPQARLVPVLMLTVSQLTNDVKLAYEIGASSFTVKPFSYEDWQTYLVNLRHYWYKTVSLPSIQFSPSTTR
ncbi:response regulator [Spirosoma sp.]|uniref:response regulator n=1 Tax=Spirosoma sp. TaxID=1899569 RepID=UPI0026146495|nr:response regulator [Spirosoma sp.]MCX6212779.1 response regulator [Spirosoma sp.]